MMKLIPLCLSFLTILFSSAYCLQSVSFASDKDQSSIMDTVGLTDKTETIGALTISYNEGGSGDSIILIHGFGGRKEFWTLFAKSLIPNYHVIAMDLPGHGNSSKLMEGLYGYDAQVENINRFAKVIGLANFHIVGNSMGGRIAGEYALKYPDRIISLGLFATIGIVSSKKSEWQMNLSKGENILMATTYKEYNEMLEFLYYKVPNQPDSIIKEDFQRHLDDEDIKYKIIVDLAKSSKPSFESKLEYIKAPTLILWGDKDRIFDVSSTEILENGISNSKSVIMKDMGHLPMIERPNETAEIYINFLKNL